MSILIIVGMGVATVVVGMRRVVVTGVTSRRVSRVSMSMRVWSVRRLVWMVGRWTSIMSSLLVVSRSRTLKASKGSSLESLLLVVLVMVTTTTLMVHGRSVMRSVGSSWVGSMRSMRWVVLRIKRSFSNNWWSRPLLRRVTPGILLRVSSWRVASRSHSRRVGPLPFRPSHVVSSHARRRVVASWSSSAYRRRRRVLIGVVSPATRRSHGWTVTAGSVLLVAGRDNINISSMSGGMRVLHMWAVMRSSHGWVASLIKRGGGSIRIRRLMVICRSSVSIRARTLNIMWVRSSHGSWSDWVWCTENILILVHNGGTVSGIQYNFNTFTHFNVFLNFFFVCGFNSRCFFLWFLFVF
mmetsp:Transcript_41806/g.100720  ORF Transcript_41806/g.100720 Transcript_41806/m.100720 type:complete len:353 (+) Transcript_41806:1348-2406(+)